MKTLWSRPLSKKLKIGTKLLQALMIPLILALIMSHLQIQGQALWVRPAGLYLLFGSSLAYAGVLLWMKNTSDHFALAALGAVLSLFYYLVVLKLRSLRYPPEWSARLGIFLISVFISFFCFQEFKGFEEVSMQTDAKTSERWALLWLIQLSVCILFVASQLLNLTHLSIGISSGKIVIGEMAVLISGPLMLLMQGVKWIWMSKTAKVLGEWKSPKGGEKITQEFEVRKIRWIEYKGENEYAVYTRKKQPEEISSCSYSDLCEYLKKRDITDLAPISDSIIINKRYIKNVSLDEKGDRFIYLSGEKKRFRVAKSYARDISWWNFEK